MGASQQIQLLSRHVPAVVSNKQAALVGAMAADQQMNVSIVLPLRNQATLTALLSRLYDPASPDYRRFLSVTEFTAQFGPTASDYQAVVAYAQANGLVVTDQPANRLVVPVRGSVAQIERAFNVEMNSYQHPTEARTFFAPDREPSVNLNVKVAHIAGLSNYYLPHPQLVERPQGTVSATVNGSGPGGSYLGSDMRAAYYGGTTLDGNGQSVGLFEFAGYDMSDVNLTFSNAGQSYDVPVNNVLLDGMTEAPTDSEGEVVLDIVQAIAMAPRLSQVRVYIGAVDADILNKMATENVAKQLSSSWSWVPDDPATDDVFFEEFAAQGQSFFVASGDDGAFDAAISPFFYPADDVYVTAVGGTHLATASAGGGWASETAWNSVEPGTSVSFGSGGGVSPDGISIPNWQTGVANTANGGSSSLRNVPDVAMEADFDNYLCSLGSCTDAAAGTSFAAPRWAGFMALINEQAVETGAAKNGGLGFINPSLYTLAQGNNYGSDFHDVTSGNNDTDNQPAWFSATAGYDLVTGWGSANGQPLIDDLAGTQVDGFWILPGTRTVAINPGSSATTTINVTDAGGFTGNVTLSVTSALPSGVTATWGTNPTSGSSVLTLTASSSAQSSATALTITGVSGSLTATTTVIAAVHAPIFLLAASPASVSVSSSSSVTSMITATPQYGFSGGVNLSIAGLPSGITAAFTPNPATGNSTLTLTADSTVTAGTSLLTVTGTSGTLTATTTVTLTIQGPNFTLSAWGPVNVGQGASMPAYVYVNPQYGFTGNVNLSVSGLPTGVTGSLNPNPATGSSVLTLTASSAAAVGQTVLTITGTSGNLTATATLTVSVQAPTFTLSGPTSLNIGQGSSGTAYFYVNQQYGFSGNVTFSVSGLPSGVTALWNPNPTTPQSQLTLVASSSAKAGQYPLTITGTSGSLSVTAPLALGICAPTFTVGSSGSVDMGQGTTTSTYVYVNPQYGFSGNVTMSASGLPTGVTASFNPNPTTGYTQMSLTAASTASVGSSPVTITGTSGSQIVTANLTLGIHVPTFTLSGPGSVTLGQGATITVYPWVNPQYGFTGNVTLSASGLPAGVTATFTPNPSTGFTQMALTATATAQLGTGTTVTITGTSGTITASTTFSLGVYAPTFALSGPGSVTLGQGTATTAYVSVYSQYGFNGNVNLSISGLPTGVTAAFSPTSTTGSSTLTLTASGSAPLVTGTTVTITGTSGSITASTTFTLGVYVPTFTLTGGGSISVGQGSSDSTNIWVYPENGFNGSVNLSVTGVPSGVTATFSPTSTTASSVLTIVVSNSAAVGQSTLTITGTSGGVTASTTLTLNVVAESFTLGSTGAVTMNEGSTGAANVYVYGQYGFAGNVTLSASGLPSGVTAAFSPNPTGYNSTMTVTASNAAVPGTSTVTITGTSGNLSASTHLTVTINTPGFTISDAPGNVNLSPSGSGTSSVYINAENAFSGNVNLAASGLPSGVSASFSPNPTSTGVSVLTLTASSSVAPATASLVITATSGSFTATAPLTVTVGAAPSTTSTSLAVTAGGSPVTSVAAGTAVTLSAAVNSGSTAITTGQVNICEATATTCNSIHRIGSAQLTSSGSAGLTFIPGRGIHSYKAVFVGTHAETTSSSSPANLTVTAAVPTATTIAQSGSAGDYALTATVTGQGSVTPTGTVSFLDTSNSNFPIGSASLGAGHNTMKWISEPSLQTGTNSNSIAIGDFNGDGIPDLAVANSGSGTVTILLGKGDGTFSTVSANPQTANQPTFVAVGDFNRDGKTDLAVVESNGNVVEIFLGNGDGTFTAAPSVPTGSSPVAVAVGDFNGDGLVDLAIANSQSDTVTIQLGNGDGTFTPSALSSQTGNGPSSIVTADFNGDGILDLAVANAGYNGNVTILLGNGDGSFVPAASLATGTYSTALVVGDFNGDGMPDLAVTNSSSDTVMILLGNGDGTFSASAATPSTGENPNSIAAGDFNADGKTDLAIANGYGSALTILLGNGDGTFTAGASPAASSYPISIASADFNGDGVPDLAVANSSAGTATVFTSQLTYSVTAAATGISPAGQGTHAVKASYAGDTSYGPSASGTTGLTAQQVTPIVTITPSSSSISVAQTFTVGVTVGGGSGHPVPSGTITLTSGSYSQQQTLVSGSATFSLSAGALPVGKDTLAAAYAPDAAGSIYYIAATEQGAVTVTTASSGAAAAVTETPSATAITNLQGVTLTVSVTGPGGLATPTGTVSLSSGSYSAQQPLTSGSTKFTIAAGVLSSGANTLTAVYSGDTNYGSVTTSASVTVSQLVASATNPPSVTAGSSATTNVNLSAGSTYSGTLNLACSLTQSPAGAQSLPTCSLSPASLQFSNGGSQTTALTVHTTAASTASFSPSHLNLWGIGGGGSVLAVILMFGIPSRRRRWTSMIVLLWVAVCVGSIGCGGGGSSNSQPPPATTSATTSGTYTFAITGTDSSDSSLTTSVNMTITVQ